MLEIILTIIAWNRGWRGWALIPMAVAFVLGFMLAASSSSPEDIMPLALAIDGLCIVALIVLIARPRRVSAVGGSAGAESTVVPDRGPTPETSSSERTVAG